MSPQRPDAPGSEQPDDTARLAGVEVSTAALAREIDSLRRVTQPLAGLPGRVDALADIVTELATKVAALTTRRAQTPCPSWLLAPTDLDTVAALIDELRCWLEVVFLRYPDAVNALPECWPWHPDVVEELLWLMHAWLAAYQGPAASVALVADWHDRQRPGVVRRISKSAGSCSREAHTTRAGWNPPVGAPTLPAGEASAEIAAWWAYRRTKPAPEPGPRPDTPAEERRRAVTR